MLKRIGFLLVILVLAAVPSRGYGQAQQSVQVEALGGYADDPLAILSAGYVKRWTDSFSWRLSLHWLHHDLDSTARGALGADARIQYTFDFLSIVPSVFLGIGGGYDFGEKNSYVMFLYGLSADYIQSRRFRWGLSFGGVTLSSGGTEDNETSTRTGWFAGVRLEWILGEEW